jgi:RNA polymerase sigma factor (sigma-70 family)
LHAEQPYLQLLASLRAEGVPIVTGVRSIQDVWRMRISVAEAEHRGSWVAIEPGEIVAKMRRLHTTQVDWDKTCAELRAAGLKHPALLAAWLDLDPEKIEHTVKHNNLAAESASVEEITEQDTGVRAEIRRTIDSELMSTEGLIESLVADGEVDDARAIADEWWRWTKTHDSMHSELADSWRQRLSTMKSEPPTSIARMHAANKDWALLDRWAAGDRAAGSELVQHHYRGLSLFVKSKVPENDSEDLIQDTFTQLAESTAQLNRNASLRTEIFRIARGLVRQYYSHRSLREPTDDVAKVAQLVRDFDSDLWSVVADREELQLTLDALQDLPLLFRYVVELRVFQEMSWAEIAGVLEVPEATARSRYASALRHLRRKVDAPVFPLR